MYGLIFSALVVFMSGGRATGAGFTLPTLAPITLPVLPNLLPSNLIPTTPITVIPTIPTQILPVLTNKIPVGVSIPTTLPVNIFPTSVNLPTNIFPTALFTQLTWPTNLIPTKTIPTTLFPFNLFPTSFFPSNLFPTNLIPSNLFTTKTISLIPPSINLFTTKTLNLSPQSLFPSNLLPNPLFTTKVVDLNPANLLPANLNPANLLPSNLNPANLLPSNLNPINLLPSNLVTTKTINLSPQSIFAASNLIPSNLIQPTKTLNLNPASLIPANLNPANLLSSVLPTSVTGSPPNVFPTNLFSGISNFPGNLLQDIGNIQQGAQNFLNILNPSRPGLRLGVGTSIPRNVANCGGSTNADTMWQNPAYPKLEGNLPGICTLTVTPPAGTCALRVSFDDLVLLPAFSFLNLFNFYSCNQDAPFIKMYYNGATTRAYCSDLSKYEGIAVLDSNNLQPAIFLMQLDSSNAFKFRVNVTNVPCSSINTFKSPTVCGIKNDKRTGRSEILNTHPEQGHSFGEESTPAPVRRSEIKQANRQAQSAKRKLMAANLRKKPDIFSQALAGGLEDGKVKLSASNTRVLGTPTGVGEYPWMVAIQRRIEVSSNIAAGPSDFGICSGVLLDNQHVLTSASCIQPIIPISFVKISGIRAVVGEHNLSTTAEALSVNSSVSGVTFPLSFNPILLKDDVAVLTLSHPITYQQNIRPVCLPVDYNVFTSANGVVSGWDGQDPLSVLKATDVQINNATYCNKTLNAFLSTIPSYFGMPTTAVNYNDYVCAERGLQGSPVCFEDLGIPLVRRDQTGAYFLEGMSTTFSSCGTTAPNIFSRIGANSTFINLALA